MSRSRKEGSLISRSDLYLTAVFVGPSKRAACAAQWSLALSFEKPHFDQGFDECVPWCPAALVVSILDEAVQVPVAEVPVYVRFPVLRQVRPVMPDLAAVVLQRGFEFPLGVVRFVEKRVVGEPFLNPAHFLEGVGDGSIGSEDPHR